LQPPPRHETKVKAPPPGGSLLAAARCLHLAVTKPGCRRLFLACAPYRPPPFAGCSQVDADAPRHFGDDFDEADMALPQQPQQQQ